MLGSALVATVVALSAPAAGDNQITNDFCMQPVKSVCNFPFVTGTGRALLAYIGEQNLKKKVLADFAKKLKRDPKTFTDADLQSIPGIEGTSVRFDFAMALYKARAKERRAAEWRVVVENFENVKKLMKQAIAARAKKTPKIITLAKKRKLEKALDDIQLLDMNGVFELKKKQPKKHAEDVERSFVKWCGFNGMAVNAYASRYGRITNPVRRYLIICPGLILTSVGKDQSGWMALPGVLSTVLHELAHHIDHHGFPELYDTYETCATKWHSHMLAPIADDALKVSWLTKSPDQKKKEIVKNHMAEISADLWAIEAFSIYLAKFPAGNRLDRIRMSFGQLCGTGDEGHHPTGDFRLQVLLRGDPQIASLMGCPKKQRVATTCSMDGANVASLMISK